MPTLDLIQVMKEKAEAVQASAREDGAGGLCAKQLESALRVAEAAEA